MSFDQNEKSRLDPDDYKSNIEALLNRVNYLTSDSSKIEYNRYPMIGLSVRDLEELWVTLQKFWVELPKNTKLPSKTLDKVERLRELRDAIGPLQTALIRLEADIRKNGNKSEKKELGKIIWAIELADNAFKALNAEILARSPKMREEEKTRQQQQRQLLHGGEMFKHPMKPEKMDEVRGEEKRRPSKKG